jgi:8-oxo-dGTP diphosphatase
MRTELAGGVIVDPDGRLLLIHRNTPELTQWELPGGNVELGETPDVAVIREIREELGIEIVVGRELGKQDFSQNERYYECRWLAAIIIGDVRPYPQEAIYDDCRYFTAYELQRMDDLSPNMRNLAKKVVDGDVSL